MSDTILASAARRCILAAAALTAGCQIPASTVEHNVSAMEPSAVSAAQERARTDLDCGAVKTTVLSREVPPNQTLYTLARYVYRIEAQGCGRKTVFSVACVANSPCSAMSESGVIERVKQVHNASERAATHFNSPQPRWLQEISLAELEDYAAQGHFPAGGMGPEVEVIRHNLSATPQRRAIITGPPDLGRALAGATGTRNHR